ncbi:MAG: SRPBCC domain-containing protein [Xanthobacteraceae bacterium]|nr:SRPBCC domain-containing protein [Xanthobacteraceae bacterium]
MTATATIESMIGKEVVVSRFIDAPRERVFDAWIKSEKLAQWWGPKGFANRCCEIDPRPGGRVYIEMVRESDGTLFPLDGEVEIVEAPSRIVLRVRGYNPANEKTTIEDRVTATFEDRGGKTLVTVHLFVLAVAPAFMEAAKRMDLGWSQSLQKLEGTT